MPVIQTHPRPACPDCGGQMRLKRPRQGQHWKAFWGCSQYVHGDPDSCRGTVDIRADGTPDVDTGPFRPGDFDDQKGV